MLQKTMYPKTVRISRNDSVVIVTEKIDGSNLGFYVLNGELFVAQRNWVYSYKEIMSDDNIKKQLYKGLYQYLLDYGYLVLSTILDGAIIFGEWVGMGKLKYNFKQTFLMFAKGRIDNGENVTKLVYNPDLFMYAFTDQQVPIDCLDFVPLVAILNHYPDINELDEIYDGYTTCNEKTIGRNVEGFVINQNNNIRKYVRMKNGILTNHMEKGDD